MSQFLESLIKVGMLLVVDLLFNSFCKLSQGDVQPHNSTLARFYHQGTVNRHLFTKLQDVDAMLSVHIYLFPFSVLIYAGIV